VIKRRLRCFCVPKNRSLRNEPSHEVDRVKSDREAHRLREVVPRFRSRRRSFTFNHHASCAIHQVQRIQRPPAMVYATFPAYPSPSIGSPADVVLSYLTEPFQLTRVQATGCQRWESRRQVVEYTHNESEAVYSPTVTAQPLLPKTRPTCLGTCTNENVRFWISSPSPRIPSRVVRYSCTGQRRA